MKVMPIILITALFGISCSHVEVSGYNRDANTVTIEASGFANEMDAQKEADRYCAGPARLVSMDKRHVGTSVHKIGNTFSSSEKNHIFYTFSCKK